MKRNPVLVVLWKNKVGMCSLSSAIQGIFYRGWRSAGIAKPSSFILPPKPIILELCKQWRKSHPSKWPRPLLALELSSRRQLKLS